MGGKSHRIVILILILALRAGVLALPANIYAAIKRVDYQKATFNGSGANYLWFRIPLQILFIVWMYLSCIT